MKTKIKRFLAHSKNELTQWRGVRRLSVRPSVCKLLRKSLLLADKWPDRHQTCTWWTPGQRASRVCSRSRSKVTWYAHFLAFLEWATPSLTVWLVCIFSGGLVLFYLQCESKKSPSLRTCGNFPKRLGIFQPNFTGVWRVPTYATLWIFIQLPATSTKLCHIKHDHPVHIICAKCPVHHRPKRIFWHFSQTVRNF